MRRTRPSIPPATIRILILNQYYPPDASNTARLLEDFVEQLAGVHDVEVIAGRPSYSAGAIAWPEGKAHVRRVRSLPFARGTLGGRAINYLSYLGLSLVASVRTARPDVIVAQTDPPVIGAIAALAAMRFRCRFVFVCHDVHPDIGIAMGVIRNRPLIAVWRVINRFIRRRADRIVVVGRDMAQKLKEEGVDPAKIVYVPTWSVDGAAETASSGELRDRLGWGDRFVVMHAGNIGLAQNIEMFPRLAEQLSCEPEMLIVLMGDGAARPALERDIQARGLSNIQVLPYQSRADAHALMAVADAHVVSLVPGLWGCAAPSKTYAVMAAGRPFVAAVDADSEPARIVEEWACGYVVAPGDDRALAAALVALKESGDESLGVRARHGFEAQFSAGACIARLRAVIES